jgi:hypothetical protein
MLIIGFLEAYQEIVLDQYGELGIGYLMIFVIYQQPADGQDKVVIFVIFGPLGGVRDIFQHQCIDGKTGAYLVYQLRISDALDLYPVYVLRGSFDVVQNKVYVIVVFLFKVCLVVGENGDLWFQGVLADDDRAGRFPDTAVLSPFFYFEYMAALLCHEI